MNEAVERAIDCIWDRYSEPLSLSEIARSALLSRFYFARTFRDATGITPGRFLAAVRIYQAKLLLLSTSTTITDISFTVGYGSLGSFTNYFTHSVGVSPSRFRRIVQGDALELPRSQPLPTTRKGTMAGRIIMPPGYAATRVYIGTFTTPIVQHRPPAAMIIDISGHRSAPYVLPDVPVGTWFVHAVAVADTVDPEPWTRRTLLVGRHDPVTVTEHTVTRTTVRLRTCRPTDPPILLALPDLEPRPADQAAPHARQSVPSLSSAGDSTIAWFQRNQAT
jgi:AraC-like DNA-binding protein